MLPFSYCNFMLGKMTNVFLFLKIMSLLKNAITWIITNNVIWNKVDLDQKLHIFAVEVSHRHNLDYTAQSWQYDHWIKRALTHYKTKMIFQFLFWRMSDWMKNRCCKIRKSSKVSWYSVQMIILTDSSQGTIIVLADNGFPRKFLEKDPYVAKWIH